LAADRLGIFVSLVLLLDVRENSSTEKATYKLLKEILSALNNKNVGGIFCDLHNALDCVNRKILLAKMEFYGITGSFYNLIRSYVEYRYQKVQIGTNINSNTLCSEWKRSSHGVLQGSILESLLFLLYINDLPTILCNISVQVPFADDTSVIITNINVFHIVLYYTTLYSCYDLFHILLLKRIYEV